MAKTEIISLKKEEDDGIKIQANHPDAGRSLDGANIIAYEDPSMTKSLEVYAAINRITVEEARKILMDITVDLS